MVNKVCTTYLNWPQANNFLSDKIYSNPLLLITFTLNTKPL